MRSTNARWLAVAAVVLGLVAVAIAARSSQSHPFALTSPHSHASVQQSISVPVETQSLSLPPSAPQKERHFDWITALLAAIFIVLAALSLFVRRRWRFAYSVKERRRRPTGRVGAPIEDLDVPEEIAEAIDESLLTIERGPVSDAIIQCWVRVETAATTAGTAPTATDTSTEFVDRVLGRYGVREPTLRRMSALYREARFSSHAMPESRRDEARELLEGISADLRAATPDEPDPAAAPVEPQP